MQAERRLDPIVGAWVWGGRWLAQMGFSDFAVSTVIHSTGGWAALAGVLVVGPRWGKFRKKTQRPPPPLRAGETRIPGMPSRRSPRPQRPYRAKSRVPKRNLYRRRLEIIFRL